ncbi:hypothetical protein [Paenibacillus tengchongensis]|uniref:hypothetical protein n=1 Tax=Paenibacillus tengchongensis TaxID=2608684 RepID=UPI00124D598B|nr:hypothetical protein [Paenibacillus tengchongensis]
MAGVQLSYSVTNALGLLVQSLDRCNSEEVPAWLLGGSCGQLLQGVVLDKGPRDIDLYSDLADAGRLRACMARFAADEEPLADDSGGCFSLRSRFSIGGAKVELVSGFTIGWAQGSYPVYIRRLLPYANAPHVPGIGGVPLLPLAQEWVCCRLRGRQERALRIAEAMRRDIPAHLPLLWVLAADSGMDEILRLEFPELAEFPEPPRYTQDSPVNQEGSMTYGSETQSDSYVSPGGTQSLRG